MSENADRQMLCEHAFSNLATALRLAITSNAEMNSITRAQLRVLRNEVATLEQGYVDVLEHESFNEAAEGGGVSALFHAEEFEQMHEFLKLLELLLGGDALVRAYLEQRASGDPRGDSVDPALLCGAIKRCVTSRRRIGGGDVGSVLSAGVAKQALDTLAGHTR